MLESMYGEVKFSGLRRLAVVFLGLLGVVLINTTLLAKSPRIARKIESAAKKKVPAKKTKIPKRGPLPEDSECIYHHLKGKIRNEYGPHPTTKTRVWLRSSCAVTVPSAPPPPNSSSITDRNQFPLPHGWFYAINEHTQETLCINIWTGQDCPTPFRIQDLLQQPSPMAAWSSKSRLLTPAAQFSHPQTQAGRQVAEDLTETDSFPPQEEAFIIPRNSLFPTPWHTPYFGETEEQARALTMADLQNKAHHEKEGAEATEEEGILDDFADAEAHASEMRLSFTDYAVDRIIETDLPPLHSRAEEKIQHFCRHYVNEHQRRIYPRTIIILSLIYEHFQDIVHVQSAHRFQARTTSRHYGGRATDIWVSNASKMELARYVWSIGKCRGVGVIRYPDGFVHIDSRDPPSYWAEQVYYVVRSAFKPSKAKGKKPGTKKS